MPRRKQLPGADAPAAFTGVQEHPPLRKIMLASAHPHWEYCTVTSENGRDYYGSGMIAASFNDLGLLGWELTAVYRTGDAMHAPIYYAVFKREVKG